MLVSIVIVNYRVKYFLEQTIRSAKEAIAGIDGDGEIIVIDNNSGDDSVNFISQRFGDEITIIENKTNTGFARANNQGFAVAKGEFILILNPDTIIGHDTLKQCIEWMNSHDDCGAIGVRMLDGNGSFLPESKRAFTSPWVSACKLFGLSRIFPKSRIFARYSLPYLSEKESHQVDTLAGAFIFARTQILNAIGGFDEDFFMYGEDADLSYRIIKSGYHNYYLPIPIIHYKGQSTIKDSIRYVKVFYKSMLIFYRKHYAHYNWFFSAIVRSGIFVRASIASLSRIISMPFHRRGKSRVKLWRVISDDPEPIITLLGGKNNLCAIKPTDIVIDDRCHTYQQIISLFDSLNDGKTHFHIYSGHNGILLTPKMSHQ